MIPRRPSKLAIRCLILKLLIQSSLDSTTEPGGNCPGTSRNESKVIAHGWHQGGIQQHNDHLYTGETGVNLNERCHRQKTRKANLSKSNISRLVHHKSVYSTYHKIVHIPTDSFRVQDRRQRVSPRK